MKYIKKCDLLNKYIFARIYFNYYYTIIIVELIDIYITKYFFIQLLQNKVLTAIQFIFCQFRKRFMFLRRRMSTSTVIFFFFMVTNSTIIALHHEYTKKADEQ